MDVQVSAITIGFNEGSDMIEEVKTGVPLIPIQIGEYRITKALVDYDASVSVLSGSVYDKFDFWPLQEVDTTSVLRRLT